MSCLLYHWTTCKHCADQRAQGAKAVQTRPYAQRQRQGTQEDLFSPIAATPTCLLKQLRTVSLQQLACALELVCSVAAAAAGGGRVRRREAGTRGG